MADKGAASQKGGNKKKGRPRSAGRHSAKYSRFSVQLWAERRLRRILRHNGEAEARKWAEAHDDPQTKGASRLLERLLKERSLKPKPAEPPVPPAAVKPATAGAAGTGSGCQHNQPTRTEDVKPVLTVSHLTFRLGEALLPVLANLWGISPQQVAERVAEEAAKAPAPKPVKAKPRRKVSARAPAAPKPVKAAKPRRKVSAKKALTDFFHKKS